MEQMKQMKQMKQITQKLLEDWIRAGEVAINGCRMMADISDTDDWTATIIMEGQIKTYKDILYYLMVPSSKRISLDRLRQWKELEEENMGFARDFTRRNRSTSDWIVYLKTTGMVLGYTDCAKYMKGLKEREFQLQMKRGTLFKESK